MEWYFPPSLSLSWYPKRLVRLACETDPQLVSLVFGFGPSWCNAKVVQEDAAGADLWLSKCAQTWVIGASIVALDATIDMKLIETR